MGNHYVSGALVGDGLLDASRPEVLIYETSGNGLQLVGVEFVVFADTWLASHSSPPVLEGQSFQFVPSPNRYGLPAHFELHVWAWRENPNGAFRHAVEEGIVHGQKIADWVVGHVLRKVGED